MKTGHAKQAGSILLAVLLGASGVMGTGCLAFAEEATEAVNEQSELETELDADAADAEIEITELEITIGEETLIVSNATGIAVEPVSAGEASEDADGAEDTDSESVENADAETAEAADSETAEGADTESAEDDAAVVLVFTTEDGTVHTFEIADAEELTALTDLILTEKIGFFFLYGTDGNGDAKYYYETADEITLEEAVTMYTTGQVTVRESADGSSEALGYADRGSELEVLGGTSTWFLITQGDLTGYVAARYLTVDAEEAQAAVEAEENAQAAAAAAAQEAAAAAAAQAAAAAAAAASSAASDSSSSSQTETTQTDNACLTGGVLN